MNTYEITIAELKSILFQVQDQGLTIRQLQALLYWEDQSSTIGSATIRFRKGRNGLPK